MSSLRRQAEGMNSLGLREELFQRQPLTDDDDFFEVWMEPFYDAKLSYVSLISPMETRKEFSYLKIQKHSKRHQQVFTEHSRSQLRQMTWL